MTPKILDICQRQLDQARSLGLNSMMQGMLIKFFDSPLMHDLQKEAMDFFYTLPHLSDEGRITMMNQLQSMHLSVLSVSAIKVRIDKDENLDPVSKEEIQEQISDIIAEDVGMEGLTHHALFERFARAVTGTSRWADQDTLHGDVKIFRDKLHKLRTHGDLSQALASLIISEIWNTGEYTFAAPLTESFLSQSSASSGFNARNSNAYMAVHSGDTEFDHFIHAVYAYCTYNSCKKISIADSINILHQSATAYFEDLHRAFKSANEQLSAHLIIPQTPVTSPINPTQVFAIS